MALRYSNDGQGFQLKSFKSLNLQFFGQAVVALDYGHGSDTWENGGGKGVRHNKKVYEEHEFNADVGERIRKILEAHGVKVVVTQPPNKKDVDLEDRTNKANRLGVDAFVSLHANAGVSSASGACVFAWEGYEKTNQLADHVRDELKAQGIDLHGSGRHYSQMYYDGTKKFHWTNFHVLRETDMSAILIEHGFMTNSRDFENIFGKNKESYRQKCAIADSKGILKWFGIKYKEYEAQEKSSGDWKDHKPTPEDYESGRIGQVKITTERLNMRDEPNIDSKKVGEVSAPTVYWVYDQKGKWLNIGAGKWISTGSDGSLADLYKFPPQPKEPKQTIYRVIVDGHQIGAYAEGSNALKEIKKAMEDEKENVDVVKV